MAFPFTLFNLWIVFHTWALNCFIIFSLKINFIHVKAAISRNNFCFISSLLFSFSFNFCYFTNRDFDPAYFLFVTLMFYNVKENDLIVLISLLASFNVVGVMPFALKPKT